MKAQKILSLDAEIIDQLKNTGNASKLINDMLIEYFFSGSNLEKTEIQGNIKFTEKEILEKKQKIENLKQKLIDLENKDKKIKELFKNIPESILTDFKMFPKMSENTLLNRYNNIYFGKVKWEVLLKAFKQYFNIK